jgi:hypothetical protein
MIGRVTAMGVYTGLTVETSLDPARQPFLHDHQIGGTPVLPGVMGVEALAETARLLFPDRYVGPIEQVSFMAPFKFYRGQPRTVTLQADFRMDGEGIVADCRLVGSRLLHGQTEPELTAHFLGSVHLITKPIQAGKGTRITVPKDGKLVHADEIYRLYFHGPAYRVLESSWRSGNSVVGLFAANLPSNHEPDSLPTQVAPRLIELCFQTAGIWEMAVRSRMGLPSQIRKVRLLRSPEAVKSRLYAVATPNEDGSFDAQVVDEKGSLYLVMKGYRTMELPDPIDETLLEPLKRVIA